MLHRKFVKKRDLLMIPQTHMQVQGKLLKFVLVLGTGKACSPDKYLFFVALSRNRKKKRDGIDSVELQCRREAPNPAAGGPYRNKSTIHRGGASI